ncbi:hypothetical protein D3C73_1173110 [compost metagenome]
MSRGGTGVDQLLVSTSVNSAFSMLSSSTMAVSEKPFISSAVTSEAGPISQSIRACSGLLASSRVMMAISATETPPRLLIITARRPVSGRAAISVSTIRLTTCALFCVSITDAPGSP